MKKYIRDYAFLLSIAVVIIALDQWTKWLVRTNLGYEQSWSPWPWLSPFARVIHFSNTGAAFGMFQGFSDVFTILAILVSLAILYYFPQVPSSEWPLRFAMGLQLGGAVGNLIDRLTIGHVTDFISVGNFAVFNVADASISIGVAVLIIGFWIKDMQEKKQTQQAQVVEAVAAIQPSLEGEPLAGSQGTNGSENAGQPLSEEGQGE